MLSYGIMNNSEKKPYNSIFLFIRKGMYSGWLPFVLYLLISVLCAFFRELVNVDELWNYTFGLNISRGMLPYRDFNYLQTPFSALVNGALLILFGRHIVVMRLAGAVLFTFIAMRLFRTSRQLGADPLWASLPGFATIIIFSVNIFFEYSDFILFLLLTLMGTDIAAVNRLSAGRGSGRGAGEHQAETGIPTEMEETAHTEYEPAGAVDADESPRSSGQYNAKQRCDGEGDRRKANAPSETLLYKSAFTIFMTGIPGGLAILSKQTYGAFTAAASWLAIFVIFIVAGRGVRKSIKAALIRFAGTMIPCVIFLIYLLASGTFGDFWDMCVSGIGTFTSYYRYTTLMKENPGYFIACLAMPACTAAGILCAVVWFVRRKAAKCRFDSLRMTVILIYTIFGFINMVPLANLFHFEICSVPVMLTAELMMARFLPYTRRCRFASVLRVIVRAALYVAIAAELIFLVIWNPVYISKNYTFATDIKGFEGTFMSKDLYKGIHAVDEFIEQEKTVGHEVYVLDNRASFYMDPLNIYHKYLDFFLIGNLGTKTPMDCLRESLLPGNVYLIPSDMSKNTQYPKNAVTEFMTGLERDGDLEDYEIYRVPDENLRLY